MITSSHLALINLSGTWRFTPEGGSETTIQVPGGGWLKQGFSCESGLYERELEIPDPGVPAAFILALGAVNHHLICRVGPNRDSLLVVHDEVTAFTGQTIDLTKHVRPATRVWLQLEIRAWRGGRPIAPHCAEWCESIARGLFRSAELIALPLIHLDQPWVETSVANRSLTVRTTVCHRGTTAAAVRVGGRCFAARPDAPWTYPELPTVTLQLEPGEQREVTLGPVDWTAGPDSFWWPNTPYRAGYLSELHHCELALQSQQTEPGHTVAVRFGFRELKQQGAIFTLNGVRVNFRGDNLQVANYDRIDHGGRGNAIDTLPGFLPPTATCTGWPGAVDNFLRLNYNVQREHMTPWSPYMLNVCDERGLMLIGESACRWDGFDMDAGRGFHEMKCLADIIRRDRHHPAIVRWSSKNETQCLDPDYHVELYETIHSLDATRPIYEDIVWFERERFVPRQIFAKLLDRPDFTWIDHYLAWDAAKQPYFTTIQHSDAVMAMDDRPYGVGEADWMRSSTPAGLTWFATTIALARLQGASDARPYVLLSSWASSIPGVRHLDFLTEENRHPVYGEDNLPEPWKHHGIQLLQTACHPLLALDAEFWRANRASNAHGHFPVQMPVLQAQTEARRDITLFNDEFAGEQLELRWSLREGSPDNRVCAKGSETVHVSHGGMATVQVAFTTPIFNTFLFLVLEVWKQGELRFRDHKTTFEITGGQDFRSEFNGEARQFV